MDSLSQERVHREIVPRKLRECPSEFALELFHVALILRFERDIEPAFVRSKGVITQLGATDSLRNAPYMPVLEQSARHLRSRPERLLEGRSRQGCHVNHESLFPQLGQKTPAEKRQRPQGQETERSRHANYQT